MIEQFFNHYKILRKIGEGGMGEVYLAEDTRLERKVALKFLSMTLPADREADRRFRLEARAAAALNHPHVVTVHEIGEHDSRSYIAMEYIDGKSLRDLIKSEALPVEQTLKIVCQICEGLQKAHKAGIVHRDLKPENIMLDADGNVRILDFGVAKFKGDIVFAGNRSSFGTIAYMSPERCEGHEVDERADIWALGVMLYEMITGKLPFAGDHEVAILYSIVNEERQQMSDYKADIPESLQRIADKALAKDREQRYQNIPDLLADLERERKSLSELTEPSRVKGRKIKWTLAVTAGIVFLLALGQAYLSNSPSSSDILPIHTQVTFTGDATWPTISNDGQFMAYVTGKRGSNQQVWVQYLAEASQPLAVHNAKACSGLRWSPDGSELALSSLDSTLQALLITRQGDNSVAVDAGDRMSWSPDGTQIASVAGAWEHFRIADKRSGKRTQIYLPGAYNWLRGSYNRVIDMDWSPLGNRLVILTRAINTSTIWTTKIDGSQQQKVVVDSLALASPRWSGDGEAIYYLRADGQTKNLMRLYISSKSGRARGKPSALLVGLAFGDYFTISRDNKRLLYTRAPESNNLWLVTIGKNGQERRFDTAQITTGTSWVHDPAISPDGKMVAFSIGKPPRANLFAMPLEGGDMRQLTFLNSYNSGAVWSPDGREIAFGSSEDRIPRVWKIGASGGRPRPFSRSELSDDWFSLAWAPGANILYQQPGNTNYSFLDPETENEWPLVKKTGGWLFEPRYSPDGKNVAVYHNLAVDYSTPDYAHIPPDYGPDYGLWLISVDGSTDRRLLKDWLYPIKWSADGKGIYAWDWERKAIYEVFLDSREPEEIITLPFDFDVKTTIDMTADETRFIVPVLERKSDVWLVEHFDPESELAAPITPPYVPEMEQLTYLQNGLELKRQGRYAEAEKVLRQGLEINPDNLYLLRQVAWTLYHRARYEEAEDIFSNCLKMSPEHVWVLNAIRRAAFYAKHYQDAKRYNEKYMEGIIRPDKKVPMQIMLGAINLVMKDYTGAEKQFREALSIDSASAPASMHMGYLFAVQERFGEALYFSEKAVSLDSGFVNQNLLAWVLIAGEFDIERGLTLAERALAAKPPHRILEVAWENEVDAYSYYATPEHTLGLSYLKKGEFEKAVKYLEQAAETYPTRPTIQEDLQQAKQKLGESLIH